MPYELECYYRKIFFSTLLVFLLCICSKAQDCSFTLSKAQKNYEAGVIEQIPQMLQPCIVNGFTKEEKLSAYKLIILCYLFDNNTAEAEKAMLNFLRRNPEYEILPTDQAEFVNLFKTYRSVPIASIGILGLTNFCLPQTFPFATNEGTYSSTGFGIQAGISYRQFISKLFDLNLEFFYVSGSYKFSINGASTDVSVSQYTDNIGIFMIPLTAIYKPITFWKFEPFVRGGLSFGYLLSSSLTGDMKSGAQTNKIANLSFINNRNSTQFWGVLGGGICFNLKKSSLMLDLRYNQGFTNYVNPTKTNLAKTDLRNNFGITENDFLLSNFWISVGYFYKFYRPEKRKTK